MKKYLIIAISLLASAGMKAQQQGEIIYREFERACASFKDVPETGFGLDINNDSTCDFVTYGDFYNSVSPMPTGFQVVSSDWEITRCFNYDSIPDPSSGPGCVQWILDYFDNVRIDTLSNWHSTDYIAPYILFHKLIADTTFHHLIYGFRHKTNDSDTEQHYCYGWLECTIRWKYCSQQDINVYPYPQSTQSWLCVNRMAYCSIPDYPLRTGQTNLEDIVKEGNEWYYEIHNDDSTITYQHLECVGDTLFDRGKRPKVIVRSNTHYNRTETEVTHEYVYEENGIVYWWNRDLQEFTTLYNLNANVGDEWEIKVGTESLTMHVDAVENYEYEGKTYRMLNVSDAEDLFSGSIVCGIGHLTSFFPEQLMNRNKGFRVDGLRCYWVGDELVFKIGDEDCDAIYGELHGIEEQAENGFAVYPNPAKGVLFVETVHAPSLPMQTYRITNLMGQNLMQGSINAENQQIDIASLPAGMYFINVGEQTIKFVKQ